MAFSWSYSKLNSFEICPRRYYELTVAKSVVEPETKEMGEGKATHKALEANVLRGQPLPQNLSRFQPMMEQLKTAPGDTFAERQLAITRDFEPCGWRDWDKAWCRAIVDFQKLHGSAALAVDYKTGKPKLESDQLKLTAGFIFIHHPQVERVTTMFLWLNHSHAAPTVETYWRTAVPLIWQDLVPRAERLEKAHITNNWPERPCGLCKKWCPVTSCKHNGRRN